MDRIYSDWFNGVPMRNIDINQYPSGLKPEQFKLILECFLEGIYPMLRIERFPNWFEEYIGRERFDERFIDHIAFIYNTIIDDPIFILNPSVHNDEVNYDNMELLKSKLFEENNLTIDDLYIYADEVKDDDEIRIYLVAKNDKADRLLKDIAENYKAIRIIKGVVKNV